MMILEKTSCSTQPGSFVGTDAYTDYSVVCKAAIHAGFDRALVPLPAAVVSVVPTRRNAAR